MAHCPNFNVYDVLEPLKCPIKPTKDNNVGILVDINDDTDNICKDLSGSDLDSIKKSEFDLVDLYENIYVTPNHVKKQDMKREDSIDFSFDKKSEFGKEFDAIERKNNKPGRLTEKDIEELLKGTYENTRDATSSNYADIETKNGSKHCNHMINGENSSFSNVATQDNDTWIKNGMDTGIRNVTNSEIIEFLNKSYKTEDENSGNSTSFIFKNKELKEKLDWIKSRKDLREALINELLNTDTGNDTRTQNQDIKVLKPPTEGIYKTDNNHSQSKNSQSDLKSMLNINKVITGFNETQNNIDLSVKNLNLKTNLEIPSTSRTGIPNSSKVNNTPKENIELLQTAKLDKKVYAKRHIKSDLEKVGYTKGPSLYEKSVVLPQILNRLAARKEALIEEKKHNRRLILDFGKINACKCSSEPECLEANAKLPKETTGKKTGINTVDMGQKSSHNEVKLNPIIAMEDCNKERLLAHRVRSAFEKYILTGSYY